MKTFILLLAGRDSFLLANALAKVYMYSFSFAVRSVEVEIVSFAVPAVKKQKFALLLKPL